jgi:hypothetical protein
MRVVMAAILPAMTTVDLKWGHLNWNLQVFLTALHLETCMPAEGADMRAFLVTVLSVIAVGVLLIAYGLLVPRAAMADGYQFARPTLASQRVGYIDDGYDPYGGTVRQPLPYAVNDVRAVPASYQTYVAPAAPRRVAATRAVRSAPVRYVERPSGRDWKKTAMVIGGTTAAGAGIGAIFGGKKGALIGAAVGGGAGTLYEVKKR